MEAATTGGGGVIEGQLPWERTIRQITLAARADVLDEMRDPWNTYVDAIEDCKKRLQNTWEKYLEGEWKGDAANACYASWEKLEREIGAFASNYSVMKDRLNSCMGAVKESTHAIPIPVFAGNSLPGENGTGGADASIDGDMLYDDYQSYRGGYADFAFLHRAMEEGSRPTAERTYSKGNGYGTRQDEDKDYSDPDRLVRKAAVENWYGGNQNAANQAHDKLVTAYAHVINNLPHSIANTFSPPGDDRDGERKDPGDRHLPGGGDGSGLAYGAGSFGAVGGAGLGAGAMHASLPSTRHSALPSPPSSITDGIRLAGDPAPNGVGTVGGTSLSGGTASRLPLTGSTPGGGAGSFGAVGAGGAGAGFGGVPGTSTPQDGWWSRPPSGAMGPATASPAAQLAAGRSGATGSAARSNGVGMMPHGGGSGNQQREERQTWLIEDDEDVFRVKPATPGLIE